MKHLPKWLEESLPEAITPEVYTDGQDDTVPRLTVLDVDLVGPPAYSADRIASRAGSRPEK